MQRAPPNPRKANHVTEIEPDDVEEADVGSIAVFVFDDPDSRVVVDADQTWEFVINDEVAYSRWKISQLPEWIEPVLSRIGIRAVRTGKEDV
ncbi:hypothetical protein [Halobellus inordinatus]|uniref:hypothetical protein n=1 Tax=Halobellus inordinatus TaxID=1126236 RepID=UPI002113E96F|nr:hypothetical protein [Halobellus ramosii]